MTSTSKNARIAGFLYLLLVIVGPLRLMYIPTTLFVHGSASATGNNIAAHDNLFALGIVGDLFCGTIVIFAVLALYRLFKGVVAQPRRKLGRHRCCNEQYDGPHKTSPVESSLFRHGDAHHRTATESSCAFGYRHRRRYTL